MSFLALSARTWRETKKHLANYDVEMWPHKFLSSNSMVCDCYWSATHKTCRLTSILTIHFLNLPIWKLWTFETKWAFKIGFKVFIVHCCASVGHHGFKKEGEVDNWYYFSFFNSILVGILMTHMNFQWHHVLRQGQTSNIRLNWTQNQVTTIWLCNWCTQVVCPFLFLLPYLMCPRSLFCQMKETNPNRNQRSQKKFMMFLANVEKFGLHNFHGHKCSRPILGKLTMWNALCVWLWRGTTSFWVKKLTHLINMRERWKRCGTCHVWARKKVNFMWTRNAILSMMSHFHCWRSDWTMLKRGKLPQFYIYYNKADLCWSMKLWTIVLFFQCSPKP